VNLRRLAIALAAGVGLLLLGIVLRDYVFGGALGDECAYRLGAGRVTLGEPLYDPSATPGVTPCAYFYPPLIAQLLVAVYALVETPFAGAVAATAVSLVALFYLAGPRPWPMQLLIAAAFIAFLPVAAELKFRNLHLPMTVAIVVGLRGHPWAIACAAFIKFNPLVLLAHLAGRRDWTGLRTALMTGIALGLIGFALSPSLWIEWLTVMGPVAVDGIPYPLRLAACALVAGIGAHRLPVRWSEPLTVFCTIAAAPIIYPTTFVLLLALPRLSQTRAD
jgi:hypothetical protein